MEADDVLVNNFVTGEMIGFSGESHAGMEQQKPDNGHVLPEMASSFVAR